MPQYHFHFRSGHKTTLDEAGAEFRNLDAAREEALASARELLADAIKAGSGVPERIVIADTSGREMETVSVKDVLPPFLRNERR